MELRMREVDFKAGAKSKGSNGGVAVGLPHRNYSVFKQTPYQLMGSKKNRPTQRSAHSYPQLSGGVVRAEETCALNEQVKRKPSPPKDFHSWSRITIASDVAASFSDQQ